VCANLAWQLGVLWSPWAVPAAGGVRTQPRAASFVTSAAPTHHASMIDPAASYTMCQCMAAFCQITTHTHACTQFHNARHACTNERTHQRRAARVNYALQSKLASLAAEAQVVQAAATSSFEWRGMRCALALEKLRVPLHSAKELASSLGSAMDTGRSATVGKARRCVMRSHRCARLPIPRDARGEAGGRFLREGRGGWAGSACHCAHALTLALDKLSSSLQSAQGAANWDEQLYRHGGCVLG
jgi:hypothetical protein